MSAGEILKQAVEIGFRVGPSVVEWIADLIRAGKSGDEAEAIVRRDIKSRRAEYESAKAEDMAALDEKHAPRCANCGNPKTDHPYRHPFVAAGPSGRHPIGERETPVAPEPPSNPFERDPS